MVIQCMRAEIGQVYNDARIPIIKRYKNHWATEGIARSVAAGWRKIHYRNEDIVPLQRYAQNAINSLKRDPTAPRGRYNSVSKSVKRKVKKAQHTEEQVQGSSDRSDPNVHVTDVHPLVHPTPGPSDLGQTDPNGCSIWQPLQQGVIDYTRNDQADPFGMRSIFESSLC